MYFYILFEIIYIMKAINTINKFIFHQDTGKYLSSYFRKLWVRFYVRHFSQAYRARCWLDGRFTFSRWTEKIYKNQTLSTKSHYKQSADSLCSMFYEWLVYDICKVKKWHNSLSINTNSIHRYFWTVYWQIY